jgi:hypothetical protein
LWYGSTHAGYNWYQDSRSVGAVAGLAVAIVFTWRLLRSNSGPQRRQPKRAPTTSSSVVTTQPNAVSIPSAGVCSSSEDLRVQNVVDEFFQPVKVRNQLLNCVFFYVDFCLFLLMLFLLLFSQLWRKLLGKN